ncbi:MAG TPA: DUF2339 domain-containing protein [Fimbriimonadaceae bacterium]|nr:DUF2339 domain-containing protein [Fimbriimonadaceae bacterium]
MASDELSELRARLERLEREVDQLRYQQGLVEGSPVEQGPPPVIESPVRPREQYAWAPEPSQRASAPPPREPVAPKEAEPAPVREKVDQEFKFGSQVLPRAGIALILIAIFTFVALAIQNGWITPLVQYIGEIALCGALIGFGVWKLNEKEDFGQVLVGGGSCGLYLSFVGGNVYKNLYGGEVVVVLFLALSLANLGFSWWRSSKSFWAIGFIGGLVAAGLPMERHDFASTLVLAAIIVVAATLLAAMRRWLRAIEVLWAITILFVIVTLWDALGRSGMSTLSAIWVLYGFSIVPIFAHALRFEPTKFDPSEWFVAIAGTLTALATFLLHRPAEPVPHSISIVGFSALLAFVAWTVRKEKHAGALVATALVGATMVAPMGLTAFQACLTYAALGIIASLFTYARRKSLERPAVLFCTAHVALSIIAYAFAMTGTAVPAPTELAMLGAVGLGICNLAFVAGRMESKMEQAVTLGSVLLYFALIRASFVSFFELGIYATIFSTAAYAIVLSIVSLRAKWQGPAMVGLTLIGLTTFLYWAGGTAGAMGASEGRQIAALSLSTVALVVSTMAIGRNKSESRTVSVLNSALGIFIVVPLFWQALQVFGMYDNAAFVLALSVYAIVLAAVSSYSRWKGNAMVGMIVAAAGVFGIAFLAYSSPQFESNFAQMPLVMMSGAALAATAYFSGQDAKERRTSWLIASVIGWYVVSRLFYLVLTLPAVGTGYEAAWQTSWSLYAVVLCIVSLRTKWQPLAFVASVSTLLATLAYWGAVVIGDFGDVLGQQILVTGVTGAAVVLCALGIGKHAAERKRLSALGAIVGWTVIARFFALLLMAVGMLATASTSFAWALYAGALLAAGFAFDAKPMRITSLALFGLTICKVMIFDLSELEAYIRVLVLIVLGVLLIIGGYMYLRRRERASTA